MNFILGILSENAKIDSTIYCNQFDRLKKLLNKRNEESNANIVRQKLLDFQWEILSQPLYSPDLEPTDFY